MQITDSGSLSGHTTTPGHEPEPGNRRRRRGRAAFAVGLLALIAVTATAAITITIGSSSSSPEPRGKPAATPPSSGASRPASPPEPSITGTVHGGVHEGDLRHFLLPVPEGAETYGDHAGDVLTFDDVAIDHDQSAEASLRRHGFRGAAHRAYRTADGKWEVDVELIRFGSTGSASRAFAEEHGYDGTPVTIPGDPRARASRLDSAAAESTDALIAVSYEGDVTLTITVTGTSRPTADQMAELLDRQYARLRTGR